MASSGSGSLSAIAHFFADAKKITQVGCVEQR